MSTKRPREAESILVIPNSRPLVRYGSLQNQNTAQAHPPMKALAAHWALTRHRRLQTEDTDEVGRGSLGISLDEHTVLLQKCLDPFQRPAQRQQEIKGEAFAVSDTSDSDIKPWIAAYGGCPDCPSSLLECTSTSSPAAQRFVTRVDAAAAFSLRANVPLLAETCDQVRAAVGAMAPGELAHAITRDGLLCLQSHLDSFDDPSALLSSNAESQVLHFGASDATLIALDKPNGSSAKTFACVATNEIFPMIARMPNVLDRNGYCLVDPSRALHPFFDIDCSDLNVLPPAFLEQAVTSAGDQSTNVIQAVLQTVLDVLTCGLVHYFSGRSHSSVSKGLTVQQQRQWAVRAWSIFSASLCAHCDPRNPSTVHAGRCSFHLHAQMQVPATSMSATEQPCSVFPSMTHHKDFAVWMQSTLREAIAPVAEIEREEPLLSPWKDVASWKLQVALQCVDWSIYTNWRAFRLPYCVKSPALDRDTEQTTQPAEGSAPIRRMELYH